jgi:aminopeptidase
MTASFDTSLEKEHLEKLEKYAQVIVKIGLNLQAGQRLMIGLPAFGLDGAPLEAYPLIRQVVKAAYQAGARYVTVNWDDEVLQRIRVEHAPADTMHEVATWRYQAALEYLEKGDAVLQIYAQDPDLLAGLPTATIEAKQEAETAQTAPILAQIGNAVTNWCVASAAIESWATRVFPKLPPPEAKTRLWETIFATCRLNVPDPIAGWQQHLTELAQRASYLNDRQYTALHYAAPGTDLTVGLPQNHVWHSGGLTTQHGLPFVANIPTEEVFTMPHKDRIDGVVTSTKPLSYNGSLIQNFTLQFSEGVVVHAAAKVGQAALDNLLDTDAGARSLGEVALVPHSSPISQSGRLFYNILYDENASNHLALGMAYRFSMQGGTEMSPEAFAEAGGNDSMIHVDFMIGSDAMDVAGITADGTAEPIMRGGEWAFTV